VGRGRQRVDGAVRIFAAGTLELLHEIKDSKQWISDVKYSPDGKYLAVGSHDNAVYLYKRRRGYARSSVFKKHNSYISHLDFSRDSQYLQSTCGAYELLFCDAHSGAQVPAASQLRNVRWETWTLPLGWPVQGIWPPCSDGTDINSVARSHSCTLLATADDFGKVKLFRYPCADKTADFQEYSGHSSHVTNVRWTASDECLISTGGNDKCVFQWRHNPFVRETAASHVGKETYDQIDDELKESNEDDGLLVLNLSSGPSSGDQFMAVKPWLGAIKAPTAEAMKAFGYVEDGKPPRVSLELEWIYGYRCHDARNNLHYNAQGDAVYHTAAVGVVLKRKAEEAAAFGGGAPRFEQAYHTGHTDDVLCLALSPCRRFAATGEVGARPVVRVWDAGSGEHLATLKGGHTRGVLAVAFGPDGASLASVGQDKDHSLAVWHDSGGAWSGPQLAASGKGSTNKVLFVEWLHSDEGGFQLATGGVKHLSFWSLQGRSARPKAGLFGKVGKIQPLVSAASISLEGSWKLVTGTATGDLYIWSGRECSISIPSAHSGAINTVCSNTQGRLLLSGGKDSHVKMWKPAGNTLELILNFDLKTLVEGALNPIIRAVDFLSDHDSAEEGKFLVGTQGSEIYEFDLARAESAPEQLMTGHFKDELWGLAIHPPEAGAILPSSLDDTIDSVLLGAAEGGSGDPQVKQATPDRVRCAVDVW